MQAWHVGPALQNAVVSDACGKDPGEPLSVAVKKLKKGSRLSLLELVHVVQKQSP